MLFKILKVFGIIQNILPISTEKNITLDYYTGKWHQVGTSRSTKLFGTGIDYKNVSALYELEFNNKINDTVLTVYNSGKNENDKFTNISGYSYVIGTSQTKRKLHFDKVPVDGNYWIVKLGPAINKKYEYAIAKEHTLYNGRGQRVCPPTLCTPSDTVLCNIWWGSEHFFTGSDLHLIKKRSIIDRLKYN